MKYIAVLFFLGIAAAENHLLSDEFIAKVNQDTTTWKAGRNFHKDTPLAYLKGLLGAKKGGPKLSQVVSQLPDDALPTEFDARKKWAHCPSVGEIRDQSSCGSCWAISAVEMMTDRQCIHKNEQFHYSTDDLLSCCSDCGYGCQGGWPSSAMNFWQNEGIVSGGQYNTSEGCMPYPLAKCEHHVKGPLPSCSTYHYNTPECNPQCEAGYPKTYESDKKKASRVFTTGGEVAMMKEIFENGPIQGAFTVYADFVTYKSGVYRYTSGDELGGHAIRILGWGVENGDKYWLVANSWNEDWGDKGYFKILKGVNECDFENEAWGGIPQ